MASNDPRCIHIFTVNPQRAHSSTSLIDYFLIRNTPLINWYLTTNKNKTIKQIIFIYSHSLLISSSRLPIANTCYSFISSHIIKHLFLFPNLCSTCFTNLYFPFSWSSKSPGVNRFYVNTYQISTWMFSGRSPQFIQYRVNSLISYAFSVKPSKRSVWKMCLYMYICVALYLLVNKLLSYPILTRCWWMLSIHNKPSTRKTIMFTEIVADRVHCFLFSFQVDQLHEQSWSARSPGLVFWSVSFATRGETESERKTQRQTKTTRKQAQHKPTRASPGQSAKVETVVVRRQEGQ